MSHVRYNAKQGVFGMESHIIHLTSAALKYGNLNIRSCGKDFFPSDAFGNSSRSKGIGTPITLKIEGLGEPVKTDIPTDKSTGRPRWIFRERKWLKEFVGRHNLKTNDLITISREDNRIYTISPNNNHLPQKESNQMTTGTCTIKIKEKPTQRHDKVEATIATAPPGKLLDIGYTRKCTCRPTNINCLTAKEWLKNQVAIWELYYEKRDIRDKDIHPAVFPIALPRRCIELFTHRGELVLDPFLGVGTTFIAARDLSRNAVGFDLNPKYIDYANKRLSQLEIDFGDNTKQIAICDDATNIPKYLKENTISLCVTSPPYANMLNRSRLHKSTRGDLRVNKHYKKNLQYSNHPRDLGTMKPKEFVQSLSEIYRGILSLLKPKAHCVINVNDLWEDNHRYPIHSYIIEALEKVGYELRNIIIWDKRNLVNKVGIFGWPSNYITLTITFEYILDFWKP